MVCTKFLRIRITADRLIPDPFNRHDGKSFLEAAWVKLTGPFLLVVEIMALAGLRLGEALAMSLENLETRNCQYDVNESTRAGRFGPPQGGRRLIDLEEALVGKVETYMKKMWKAALTGGTLPIGYMFPEIPRGIIQQAMHQTCKSARLRVRNPHDLRHTYATTFLMHHYSPAYVQKQLGRSSISITVDIYGH
jgi:integrase